MSRIFLRFASVLIGVPIVSVAAWHLITLVTPVETGAEFIFVLLLYFLWQAYILYSTAFLLLNIFTKNFWIEVATSTFIGCIAGTLCAFSVAGIGGLLFGCIVGPIFGLLFGTVVGNWQHTTVDTTL